MIHYLLKHVPCFSKRTCLFSFFKITHNRVRLFIKRIVLKRVQRKPNKNNLICYRNYVKISYLEKLIIFLNNISVKGSDYHKDIVKQQKKKSNYYTMKQVQGTLQTNTKFNKNLWE